MSLQKTTRDHLLAHHRNFDEFVQRMVDSHRGRFDEIFWSFLDQYTPPQFDRVVDLGTGPGLLLPELQKRFPKSEIWGVEAQPSMVQRAEQEVLKCGNSVRLVRHDLTQPRIPGLSDGTVDVAIAAMVLHELQTPTPLMAEVARILRPGGLWLVYDWVRMPLETYMEGHLPHEADEFTHFSEHCRYTPEDWAWMLEGSGFEVEEWLARHGGRHVLLAATKK